MDDFGRTHRAARKIIIESHPAHRTQHRRSIDTEAAELAEDAVADRPFRDRADHRRAAAKRGECHRDIRLRAADMRVETRRLQRLLAVRYRDAHDDFAETGDGPGAAGHARDPVSATAMQAISAAEPKRATAVWPMPIG